MPAQPEAINHVHAVAQTGKHPEVTAPLLNAAGPVVEEQDVDLDP
ncbi:hypothetical protein [Spirosoma agri]|nr:hypothetical protein [Spirosoma agri]